MNSVKRRLVLTLAVVVLICAPLLPGLAPPALAASSYPLQPTDTEIVNALDYLRDAQEDDGNIGGFGTSAWVVMAIAAAGEDPHTWKTASGNPSIVDYLRDNSDLIDSGKATDWERSILAIVTAGENPYDFGGIDYVSELEDLYDGTQIGYDDTLNDDFWGIMALIAGGVDPDSDIIQNAAEFIKLNQGFDGGWSWSVGELSGIDDTAAAIMALIAAGENPESDVIAMGLNFLMFCQNPDGGFPQMYPGESNAASDSWAIAGIEATDENPSGSDWKPGEYSSIDHLLSLQDADGGFKWKEADSSNKKWMTAYAIPALLGKPYPVAVCGGPPPTEPGIALSPSSFSFTATESGANPASKTLKIWNSGTGTLNWSVSDDANWLSLSPTSGNSTGEEDKDEVTVSVDILGMSADDYTATITIKDTEAVNNPQAVSVSLHIGTPSVAPGIDFSPSSFSFSATEGGANPASKILRIWNSGTGTLNWSVSDNANWLSLSPRSDSSSGPEDKDEVAVAVDISGMDAGDYGATITIRDPEAANSPRAVSVTLHIGAVSSYYSLTTAVSPTGGGSVNLDIAQPAKGYLEGVEVELSANPDAHYIFNCWTGDLCGNTNPVTVTMSGNKSVTAHFVLFDIENLPNIDLVRADSEVTFISVDSHPIDKLTNIPSNLAPQLAYLVDSAGSGNFTLSFANISSASSVKVYKVTDSGWMEIENVTIAGNVVELNMNVGDPTIVFALPVSTDNQSFIDNINSAIGSLDMATRIAVVVAIALIVAIVFVFRKIITKGA